MMALMPRWVAAAASYLFGADQDPRHRPSGRAPDAAAGDGAARSEADALRAVLAVSPRAIIAIDPDGNVRLWSPIAERMLGWTSEEVLSRPLPFVLEDGPAFARTLAQALRESGPWSGTHVRARRKDGGALDVRVWAVPVTGPAQTRAGFVLGIEEGTTREDGGTGQGGAAAGPRAPGVRGPGDENQQRLRLFTRLRAIGRTLHRPVSSTEIAESIGESARVLVGADRAAVYLCQPDGTLACPWSVGLSRTYIDQVLHHAKQLAGGRAMDGAKPDVLEVSGRALVGSTPVLYPDVQALSPAVVVPRLTQSEGYRALANWPLAHEGAVLGCVACYYDAPRTLSAPEQEAFQALSEEAAFALNNVRAREAQMLRAADLEVLFEVTRRLRTARNPREIYPILVEHAMELLHADTGVLSLLDDERPEFECVFAVGLPPEVRGSTLPFSGSPFERVAQTGTTFHTSNFGGDPLPIYLNGLRAVGPAVIAPVRSEQATIGVFCLGRKRGSDVAPFTEKEARLLEGIAEIGGNAIRRARLFENLEQSYIQMVVSLARTMDARDTYTSGHSERISQWAEAVARELGCGEGEIQDIRWGALLHDIGKIGVPDAILRKPSQLTGQEWVVMRKHPVIGEEILVPIGRMRGVAGLVRHHQEMWDGSGYPDGLKGEEIPLGARILSVCDAYSAITDDRPYKKARTHLEAVTELRRCAGTQFDPRVVEAFCQIIERQQEREKAGQRPR